MKFLKRLIPFILAIALYDLALFPGWLTPPPFKYSAEVQYSQENNSVEATYYRRARLLKTGQTTSYVAGDDGALQKGIAKSYTVLTAGQFSGTSTIKLAHYSSGAGAITFSDALDTIVDTGNGLAIFKTNDVIYTNTPNNLGPFTITTGNVAGTITCVGATFTSETPAGAVTFYKAEAHSNASVLDNNTGLMWSQTVAGKMGPASDGKLPWTTHANGYGIYPYVLAANTALLGGYGDWRIPDDIELFNLRVMEGANAAPDGTVFPGWPTSDYIFTSTTRPDDTTYAVVVDFNNGASHPGHGLKTEILFSALVRGG